MTREQFSILVKGMKAVYANQTFIPDKDAFDVWYEMLCDLPYELVGAAIKKHMMTDKFPPTIAAIRNQVSMITEPQEMSEQEVWGMVYKAICNSNYNAEAEYAKLPEVVQKAVGNPANLKECASMDINDIQTVYQSQFLRSYRACKERAKQEAMVPSNLRLEQLQRMALGLDYDIKALNG